MHLQILLLFEDSLKIIIERARSSWLVNEKYDYLVAFILLMRNMCLNLQELTASAGVVKY